MKAQVTREDIGYLERDISIHTKLNHPLIGGFELRAEYIRNPKSYESIIGLFPIKPIKTP
jgi:hypothetical protein